MNVRVRNARLDDAEAVVQILNPIIAAGTYTILDGPLTAAAERRYMAELPQRAIFHIAETVDDRRVVGFQTMEPFASYTHACDHVGVIATFVDLACRRQGIGKRLFEATFAEARQTGYEKVFTYVRGDNPAALMAYSKAGFRVVGTAARQARIGARYLDEIVIEKFL
jgi:L-amino acid N-acyltransferase YncA